MAEKPETWHYGLVAKWWAEFNQGGQEVEYFRRFIEGDGQPALDLACGTGRLLLPYLRDGLDVDGCDLSADMIALCREQAEREGLSPTLFVQAMHELDPPRRYKTVFVCGGYGIGGTRHQDEEALARIYRCLEPGGTLVLDNEVPYANARRWSYWPKDKRSELPTPWRDPGDRRRGSDGKDYALTGRLVALDPLEQQARLEIRACMWDEEGRLAAEEQYAIRLNLYFRNELLLMLDRTGFVDVVVHGGHEAREPTPDDDFIAFVAKKP